MRRNILIKTKNKSIMELLWVAKCKAEIVHVASRHYFRVYVLYNPPLLKITSRQAVTLF